MTRANREDSDQTAPKEQSDQGLHCLPISKYTFANHPRTTSMWSKFRKITLNGQDVSVITVVTV